MDLSIKADTIYISGELKIDGIRDACLQIKKTSPACIDLSSITAIDSAGVAFLDEIRSSYHVQLIHVPLEIQRSIDMFTTLNLPSEVIPEKTGFLESTGDRIIRLKQSSVDLLFLMSDIFHWSIAGLFSRKGQREGATIQQGLLIGENSLPIVGLIAFLIGLILALQSAAQLRQFGADIFVADLVGIAMLKEMGPIMTAIIVAGRSGSAITSEISTMVVTEEIDALKSMGLNPIRYVIVPKFHAITLTMPLLTILADVIGIIGGCIIGITYLQLSGAAFFNELLTILILKDVLTGLFKSLVFAWIILIVACYFGLRVSGGAEGVGRATTASVVTSIILVIVADAILGLIFYFEF